MKKKYKNPAEIAKTVFAIILVSGLILGMGTAAFVIGIQEIIGASASKTWSTVNGTVIRSRIEKSEQRTSRSSGTSITTYSYQPDVTYRYTVNNTTITGQRISWGQVTNREMAEDIILKYPLNKEVVVYYDPADPEQSVLVPGYSGGLLFMPSLGLAVIASGLLSIFVIWKYGTSFAESIGTNIGNNFLLRLFACIIGFILLAGGLIYFLDRLFYGSK